MKIKLWKPKQNFKMSEEHLHQLPWFYKVMFRRWDGDGEGPCGCCQCSEKLLQWRSWEHSDRMRSKTGLGCQEQEH